MKKSLSRPEASVTFLRSNDRSLKSATRRARRAHRSSCHRAFCLKRRAAPFFSAGTTGGGGPGAFFRGRACADAAAPLSPLAPPPIAMTGAYARFVRSRRHGGPRHDAAAGPRCRALLRALCRALARRSARLHVAAHERPGRNRRWRTAQVAHDARAVFEAEPVLGRQVAEHGAAHGDASRRDSRP